MGRDSVVIQTMENNGKTAETAARLEDWAQAERCECKGDPSRVRQRTLSTGLSAGWLFSMASLNSHSRGGPSREHITGLQRTNGNQAILRMVEPSAPILQTKLTVKLGDEYEQEANRVATQAMRMSE
jgi:beta-lactamase class A